MHYPKEIVTLFDHFSVLFSKSVWSRAKTLLFGGILSPRQRTVTAALRMTGHAQNKHFQNYHRVLSRAKWSALKGGKIILSLLLKTGCLGKKGTINIAIDETLERRGGKKILAKGCQRDAVRSSHGHVVKCFGLKWIVATVIIHLPWCSRPWALPFCSVLAYSKKGNEMLGRRHRTTIDLSMQMVKATTKWLKELNWQGNITIIGDGGFACHKFMRTCLDCGANLICRIRNDVVLYDLPPKCPSGKRGPKPKKGKKQISLKVRVNDPNTTWITEKVRWYKGEKKVIDYFSEVALWYKPGNEPILIRYIVIRDPATGRIETLCSTDTTMSPLEIIELYVYRWNIEVLFEEVRRHLGVETQRQWSRLAIERTTPCLMALFSLITLHGLTLHKRKKIKIHETAWYEKQGATFSDILAAVRTEILTEMYSSTSDSETSNPQAFTDVFESLIQELASAA